MRSVIDFYTMEMIMGSQNWQDNIWNECVYPLFKWDRCDDGVKIDSDITNHCIILNQSPKEVKIYNLSTTYSTGGTIGANRSHL